MGEHVAYSRRGALGLIELRRPEALNALSYEMVQDIAAALDEAEGDAKVHTVAIWSPEGRAFSAGGDIRAVHAWGREGRPELFQFFRDEYRLNARIANFPKPYVALVHGLVMGGGAGVSMHGSHVVLAEDASFAMPEVGIGFVPDVGATRFLNRMPRRTGLYAALTGERLQAADLVWAELAAAIVPRSRFNDVLEALLRGNAPDGVLERASVAAGESALAKLAPTIERAFGRESVDEILQALDGEGGRDMGWAAGTAALIRRQCPTSVRVAFAVMRESEGRSVEACLVNEYRAVSRMVQRRDFYEGVRAAVIDKDRNPAWRPETLAEVSDSEVAACLKPPSLGDLRFD